MSEPDSKALAQNFEASLRDALSRMAPMVKRRLLMGDWDTGFLPESEQLPRLPKHKKRTKR